MSSRRVYSLIALTALAATAAPVLAQTAVPEAGQASRFDVAPRLDQMAQPERPAQPYQKEIQLRKAPDRDKPDVVGAADPARQLETRPIPDATMTPLPNLTFEGLSDDDNAATIGGRIVPPDTEGDVGLTRYVQWNNLIFAVYDKATGNIVPGGGPFAGNSLWSGFGGPCQTNNDGDPIVIYDHLADRWFLSHFSIDEGIQCIAVTQGNDPLGPYFRWAFTVSPGENNDYPKFGLMPEAYYLSLRDFPSSDGTFASAVAFDRAALLAGSPSAGFVKFSLPCLSNDCPDGIQPPHLEGPAPGSGTHGIFTRAWDDQFDGPLTGADGYRVWELVPDFATPANSTFTEQPFIVGTPYDSTMCGFFQRSCIAQPAPGEGLDPADELQMYRAQYRSFPSHDSIVINTTVDATGTNVAGIRWAELRNTGSGWSLHQDGTYAPADGNHRWMGSAAMDGSGNIALGYSLSSGSTFPSVRYTSRLASDPLGTMPGGEVTMVAGSSVQTSSFNRWGDYSTMSVDPVDDCTFWYTQEYQRNDGDGQTNFDFKTIIGSFTIPGCGSVCGNNVIEGGEVCDGTDLGGATCGDQGCTGGTLSCQPDCSGFDTSACTGCSACDNDGLCETGEDCVTCPNDCVSGTSSGAVCGNGLCEAGNGENCVSCPADCNGKQNGKPANRFCCGDGGGQNPVACSDSRCTSGGFSCTDIPTTGGGYCCGDFVCEGDETCGNCSLDCTVGAEVCDNGIDDDCNGLADCNDQAACGSFPACQPVDCSQFTNKSQCNAQADCRWDNRNKVCIPN